MKFLLMIFALCFSLILSCKKDKFKGDKEIFIGKWKWVYTVKVHRPLCDDPPVTTILTPISEGKEFSIEFLKKGCLIFYENETKLEKYRTVFSADGFMESNNVNFSGYFSFGFDLNNKSENQFSGFVKIDTLINLGFYPFKENGMGCTAYTNYFVKE